MIQPGTHDIAVMRWQPFVYTIDFPGYDFTGATFAMQVRRWRDQPGSALIPLHTASGGQGISVSVATVDGVTTSTVEIRINKDTLNNLPFPVPEGPDLDLVYDLIIDGGGLPETRWLEGKFIVHGGSTQTDG